MADYKPYELIAEETIDKTEGNGLGEQVVKAKLNNNTNITRTLNTALNSFKTGSTLGKGFYNQLSEMITLIKENKETLKSNEKFKPLLSAVTQLEQCMPKTSRDNITKVPNFDNAKIATLMAQATEMITTNTVKYGITDGTDPNEILKQTQDNLQNIIKKSLEFKSNPVYENKAVDRFITKSDMELKDNFQASVNRISELEKSIMERYGASPKEGQSLETQHKDFTNFVKSKTLELIKYNETILLNTQMEEGKKKTSLQANIDTMNKLQADIVTYNEQVVKVKVPIINPIPKVAAVGMYTDYNKNQQLHNNFDQCHKYVDKNASTEVKKERGSVLNQNTSSIKNLEQINAKQEEIIAKYSSDRLQEFNNATSQEEKGKIFRQVVDNVVEDFAKKMSKDPSVELNNKVQDWNKQMDNFAQIHRNTNNFKYPLKLEYNSYEQLEYSQNEAKWQNANITANKIKGLIKENVPNDVKNAINEKLQAFQNKVANKDDLASGVVSQYNKINSTNVDISNALSIKATTKIIDIKTTEDFNNKDIISQKQNRDEYNIKINKFVEQHRNVPNIEAIEAELLSEVQKLIENELSKMENLYKGYEQNQEKINALNGVIQNNNNTDSTLEITPNKHNNTADFNKANESFKQSAQAIPNSTKDLRKAINEKKEALSGEVITLDEAIKRLNDVKKLNDQVIDINQKHQAISTDAKITATHYSKQQYEQYSKNEERHQKLQSKIDGLESDVKKKLENDINAIQKQKDIVAKAQIELKEAYIKVFPYGDFNIKEIENKISSPIKYNSVEDFQNENPNRTNNMQQLDAKLLEFKAQHEKLTGLYNGIEIKISKEIDNDRIAKISTVTLEGYKDYAKNKTIRQALVQKHDDEAKKKDIKITNETAFEAFNEQNNKLKQQATEIKTFCQEKFAITTNDGKRNFTDVINDAKKHVADKIKNPFQTLEAKNEFEAKVNELNEMIINFATEHSNITYKVETENLQKVNMEVKVIYEGYQGKQDEIKLAEQGISKAQNDKNVPEGLTIKINELSDFNENKKQCQDFEASLMTKYNVTEGQFADFCTAKQAELSSRKEGYLSVEEAKELQDEINAWNENIEKHEKLHKAIQSPEIELESQVKIEPLYKQYETHEQEIKTFEDNGLKTIKEYKMRENASEDLKKSAAELQDKVKEFDYLRAKVSAMETDIKDTYHNKDIRVASNEMESINMNVSTLTNAKDWQENILEQEVKNVEFRSKWNEDIKAFNEEHKKLHDLKMDIEKDIDKYIEKEKQDVTPPQNVTVTPPQQPTVIPKPRSVTEETRPVFEAITVETPKEKITEESKFYIKENNQYLKDFDENKKPKTWTPNRNEAGQWTKSEIEGSAYQQKVEKATDGLNASPRKDSDVKFEQVYDVQKNSFDRNSYLGQGQSVTINPNDASKPKVVITCEEKDGREFQVISLIGTDGKEIATTREGEYKAFQEKVNQHYPNTNCSIDPDKYGQKVEIPKNKGEIKITGNKKEEPEQNINAHAKSLANTALKNVGAGTSSTNVQTSKQEVTTSAGITTNDNKKKSNEAEMTTPKSAQEIVNNAKASLQGNVATNGVPTSQPQTAQQSNSR